MRTVAAMTVMTALLLPAAALACEEPRVSAGTNAAGPGDTVGFSVVNVNPGVGYTVLADGVEVGGGTGSPANGTFAMPDKGDRASSVTLDLRVESHSDHAGAAGSSPDTHGDTVGYTPPAASSEAPAKPEPETIAEQPAGAPGGAQAETRSPGREPAVAAPAAPQATPTAPNRASNPQAKAPQATRGVAKRSVRLAAPESSKQSEPRRAGLVAPRPLSVVSTVTTAAEGAVADSEGSSITPVGSERAGTSASGLRSPAVSRAAAAAASRDSIARPAPARANPRPDSGNGPLMPIGAVALLLTGLAGLYWRWRPTTGRSVVSGPMPPGPDTHELLIEAELQEIVSEGRARNAAVAVRESELEQLLR